MNENRMDRPSLIRALLLIILGTAADQLTKVWASTHLIGSSVDIIPKALSLVYVENPNAAFGLGSWLPDSVRRWILLGLTCVLTLLLFWFMTRAEDRASRLGFGIVIAGAIGNIIDRVRLGYVVDFIYWHGGFSWPNFNVADMLVCTGVGVLIVFGGRKKQKAEATQAS